MKIATYNKLPEIDGQPMTIEQYKQKLRKEVEGLMWVEDTPLTVQANKSGDRQEALDEVIKLIDKT